MFNVYNAATQEERFYQSIKKIYLDTNLNIII